MKNTKIIATIGPAATDASVLESFIKSGPFVARLNFSHGSFEEHGARVDIIRKLEKKLKVKVPIFQDLCGPKLRLGKFDEKQLKEGDRLTLGEKGIPVQKPIWKWIKPGQLILIDDGVIEFKAIKVGKDNVLVEVTVPGLLRPNKGVSLPGIKVDLTSLQPKDISDLEFAIQRNLDAVAFSFVKTAADVKELRAHCARLGKPDMYIIAKIETIDAIVNIKSIIKSADCIMVARGDLAVNMDQELVPLHQKMMVAECKKAGKPIIVATQMLESMTGNPRPTRAEMSDVANAVWDGADAVMLSGETANGKYPVKTVQTMREIVTMAEKNMSKVTAWRKIVTAAKAPKAGKKTVVI